MPKPQTACSLPASEGMEIVTESEPLADDRRGILEFLLINHPLDCPICDRGGECPLQNNAIHYGPPTTRFIEEKRHFPKAYPLSEHVVFDRERCIHCARCTRFTSDISGDSQLNFLKRGADMEVGTFEQTDFHSKFSGNVIELCPVGALLSRNYRFKARPWDLVTQRSICTQCSNGCNIKLDYRVSKLQRVNARVNEAVNEEWTCDKGKFGMDYVSSDDRLKQPRIKKDGMLVPATWGEANAVIVQQLKAAGNLVGGIGGARSSNEDLFAWQKLFRQTLGSGNLDHRMGPNFPSVDEGVFERLGYHTMGNSVADFEKMKSILIIGSELVDEQPILFLRVRKAWRWHGTSVVEAIPKSASDLNRPNSVSEFASVSLRYRPGSEVALILGLLNVISAEKLLGENAHALGAAQASVDAWTPEKIVAECGIDVHALRRAARLLATQDMAVIAGKAITDHPHSEAVLAALGNLTIVTGNGGNMNLPVNENNEQGAMDLGILPDSLPGFIKPDSSGMNSQQMLEAASRGGLQVLWVNNVDLVNEYHDPSLARRAIENCPFVVVNALTVDETAQLADVVLPVHSVAEGDGTFTNVERRVQRFWKAFEISPEIHPGWLIFSEIGAYMQGRPPYASAREVLSEISETVSIYKDVNFKSLGDQGLRWEYESMNAQPQRIVQVEYKAPVTAS